MCPPPAAAKPGRGAGSAQPSSRCPRRGPPPSSASFPSSPVPWARGLNSCAGDPRTPRPPRPVCKVLNCPSDSGASLAHSSQDWNAGEQARAPRCSGLPRSLCCTSKSTTDISIFSSAPLCRGDDSLWTRMRSQPVKAIAQQPASDPVVQTSSAWGPQPSSMKGPTSPRPRPLPTCPSQVLPFLTRTPPFSLLPLSPLPHPLLGPSANSWVLP